MSTTATEDTVTILVYVLLLGSFIFLGLLSRSNLVPSYDNCLFPSPPVKEEFKLASTDTLASLRRTIVDKFGYLDDSFEFAPWGVYVILEKKKSFGSYRL